MSLSLTTYDDMLSILTDKTDKTNNQFKLTSDQENAVKDISSFLQDPLAKTHGLFGYSGTGKSTLTTTITAFLLEHRLIKSVILTAPTNKAVNVLKSKFHKIVSDLIFKLTGSTDHAHSTLDKQLTVLEDVGITIVFATVHKLLNYKSGFNVSGDRIFSKNSKSSILKYDLVVVDECSMLAMKIVYDIFNDIRVVNPNIKPPKLLLVGDNAQLPPVKEEVSIVYSTNPEDFSMKSFKKNVRDINHFNTQVSLDNLQKDVMSFSRSQLNEVVRSSDHHVVSMCNEIRFWITGEVDKPDIKKYKGGLVKIYRKKDTDYNKTTTKWFKKYLKTVQNGQNNGSIILTWTNKQTDAYNSEARKALLNKDNPDRFEVNDLLVMSDFYCGFNLTLNTSDYLHTSEQVKVVNVTTTTITTPDFNLELLTNITKLTDYDLIKEAYTKVIKELNNTINKLYRVYEISVVKLNDATGHTYRMYVIDDKSRRVLEDDCERTSRRIQAFRNYCHKTFNRSMITVDRELIKPLWQERSTRLLDPFANVKYGSSMSTHKSQGSSFFNVFVDADDILNNPNQNEAKRCLYTAMSRTSNELHLLI